MKSSSVLLFCLLTQFAQSLPSQDWTIYQIDNVVEHPALALDSQGRVHISYMVPPGAGLPIPPHLVKHALWDEGAFVLTTVDSGQFNSFTAIALDQQDYPHITNHSHEDWAIRHHYWDGIVWNTEVIDHIPQQVGEGGHEGWSTSIVFDYDNHGHISHIDYPAGGLGAIGNSQGIIHVYNDGSEWTSDTVGTNPTWVFDGTSIGVNSQNNPSIAYYDSLTRNLMLAEKQIDNWILSEIDTTDDVGQYSNLKFDANDLPRIGYIKRLDSESGIVRLATSNGSSWMIHDVDTLYSIPSGDGSYSQHMISLDISSSGDSHIAYSDEVNLFYAIIRDSVVEKVLVADYPDPDSSLEGSVWLDLDSNDIPHIVYSVSTGGTPVGFYATQSSDKSIPCADIDRIQARCRPGGLVQAKVTFTDFTHVGETVVISVDQVPYLVAVGFNGKAKISQTGFNPGIHTVELTDPPGCFPATTVTCSVGLAKSDEWDNNWETPAVPALFGNYPNPFNPSTTFRYGISESGQVSLKVYDMLGQLVRTLVEDYETEGYHEVVWDGRNEVGATVSSGIYIYRMTAGGFVETRRMLFLK